MAHTLIIGANGKIGRILTRLAAEHGVPVRPMIRDEKQRGFFEELGLDPVVADLEGELDHAFEGADQVVFTAGSGPNTGYDKTLMVDLHGAVRAVDAAEYRGVRHFVMVSALRAQNPLRGPEKLRPYLAAKYAADRLLLNSGLVSTILRPGKLTDEPASGRVRTEPDPNDGLSISRENVAWCAVEALRRPPSGRRVIDLLDGDQPIEEVMAS